jgi:fructokinase
MKTVVAFGEVLWYVTPAGTILGGAPLHFTFRLSSLGENGRLVSALGKDGPGQKAFESIASLGLETEYLQWDAGRLTGTVNVSFDELKNPGYTVASDTAYDGIKAGDACIQAASHADGLYFGTLAQRSKESRNALQRLLEAADKAVKLLDLNLWPDNYSLETVQYSLEMADILKVNANEILALSRMLNLKCSEILEICSVLVEKYSLMYCAVTLDHRGAFALSRDNTKIYDLGYKVDCADAMGTGDAFAAGFLHGVLNGKPLKEACEFGNVLGAIVCTQKGGTIPVSKVDIEKFIRNDHKRVHDFYFDQFL